MNNESTNRIIIRFGTDSMSFSVASNTAENNFAYETFTGKVGISTAARLRQAFDECKLLQENYRQALAAVGGHVLLVPIEEYDETHSEELYGHTFSLGKSDRVLSHVLPDLNAVAVFAVNKDLLTVMGDHFSQIRIIPLMQPVWNHLAKRTQRAHVEKLYAYFHDGQMELFCFRNNRFRFNNVFEAIHPHDIPYYIVSVWKQLGFDAQRDELYLFGNLPEHDWLINSIRSYMAHAYIIHPSAELNRAAVTRIEEMPFDLQLLHLQSAST